MNRVQFIATLLKARINSLKTAAAVTSLPALLIVRQLRVAGALSPQTARRYHPQSFEEMLAFLRLVRAGIIREAMPGRYFLYQRAGDDAAA